MPLRDLVEQVVKNLVDSPETVRVESATVDGVTTYRIHVTNEELGQVIGKNGRNAEALRVLMRAASKKMGLGANVKIDGEVLVVSDAEDAQPSETNQTVSSSSA